MALASRHLPRSAAIAAIRSRLGAASLALRHFTHVGYCYSTFNVVTFSLWMWDGTYCLVAHDGSMRVVETRAIARDELAAPIAVLRRRRLNRAPAPMSLTC